MLVIRVYCIGAIIAELVEAGFIVNTGECNLWIVHGDLCSRIGLAASQWDRGYLIYRIIKYVISGIFIGLGGDDGLLVWTVEKEDRVNELYSEELWGLLWGGVGFTWKGLQKKLDIGISSSVRSCNLYQLLPRFNDNFVIEHTYSPPRVFL